MPQFRVIIETRDGYEKTVIAPNVKAAREQIEAEDTWGETDHGWKRTDDCSSSIVRIERSK